MKNYYEFDDDVDRLDAFLSAQEIMYLLGIGKNTMYKLLNDGKLHGFRAGKKWRVSKESFLRFCGICNLEAR